MSRAPCCFNMFHLITFGCSSVVAGQSPCAPGSYLDSLSGTCVLCDDGYSKPNYGDASTDCILCDDGRRASPSRDRCVPCPAGFECGSPVVPAVSCAPGWWSALGDAVCTPAPLGSYCDAPDSPPRPCPFGTFADTLASTACAPCPAAFSCINPGQSPLACDDGTYAAQVRL